MTSPSVIVSHHRVDPRDTKPVMHPLRIAMLSIHSSPLGKLGTGDTGGMSVYVRELSRELGRAGHRVDIFTCAGSRGKDTEVFLSEHVRLIHLRIGNNGHIAKSMLFTHLPEVSLSLESFMSSNHVRYDLIHSHYWLSGALGRLTQDRRHAPHVMMFHTTGIAKRVACGQEREPALRLVAEKRLAHVCDRILASTEREKDLLMRYYRVPGGNIGVVPCGVDLERFHPIEKRFARKELGLQDTHFVVLYVGRFAPVKGLERLLSAAVHLRSHPGLKFVIIGGDDRRNNMSAELRRLTRRTAVEGLVRFHGRAEHELLPLYYSAADVLVVPSYYESFGLVALESLACGTPVIATRVGAMDTLIQNGKTGFLVNNPSPLSLASAIERFIFTSSGRISREEIRTSVLGYGWPKVASAVAQEYRSVLRHCVA